MIVQSTQAQGGSDDLEDQCNASKLNTNGIDMAFKFTQRGESTDFGAFATFEKDEKISVKVVISMLLEQFIMLEITELATWQHMLINLS